MANQRQVTGLLWLLMWIAIITLLVLLIDIFCVFVLWSPNGVEQLQSVLLQEMALLSLSPEHKLYLIEFSQSFYQIAFVSTGIDGAMSSAYHLPPNEQTANMLEFYDTFRPLVETAMIGLQLYALRLGVLILSLPFLVIVVLTAMADGFVGWFLRRTGGARESGFIYHRAKRGLAWSFLLLWFIYLLPPVPMDPKYMIPPFLLAAGISTRLHVAFFKKFL